MTANENLFSNQFQAPKGQFSFLDPLKLIKTFHQQNQSYLVVEKDGIENHLFAYDHENDHMVLKGEVKEVLNLFYPLYQTLMAETLKPINPDFEKIALGICIGMTVYDLYKLPIIYFRNLHTYAYAKRVNFKGKRPLGDPDIPKDLMNLGFVFKTYDKMGQSMFSFDGFCFPEEVLTLLIKDFGIVDPRPFPTIYKKLLTDAYQFKGKSL